MSGALIGSMTGPMDGTTLVAVLTGCAVPAGCWLLGLGLRRSPVRQGRPSRGGRPGGWRPRHLVRDAATPGAALSLRNAKSRAVLGLVAGSVVWLLSGWLIAVVVLPAAAVGLPVLLAKSDTDAGVRRLEALEEWTRHLAGVLDVGVGLEQATMVNLKSTPAAIRPQVQMLVARLAARWSTERALRAFADDLDDATGDLVAASLVLGARRRGAGLTRVLQSLAETVADEVRMRRAVEADRAKPRTTARAVTFITLAVLALLAFNTDYIAPYGTPIGQAVLALLLAAYGAALVWMRMITRGRTAPRFLPAPRASATSATASPTSGAEVAHAPMTAGA